MGALDGKGAGRALRDGGRIIAISTLNTRLHPPGGALYTGAKGALENFTKVAAIEFGRRRITANVVSPGATATEMLRAANPGETFEDTAARTALRRLGRRRTSRPWSPSWPAPTPAGSAARTWPPTAACCPDSTLGP